MITVSDAAAVLIKRHIDASKHNVGFRIRVRGAGCSGLAYALSIATTITDDDLTFDSNGITVIVDKQSHVYLDGTEVDLEVNGLNSKIVFNNPLAVDECGCGETFRVE